MARLLIGAAFGVVVGLVAGAALNLHAEDMDGITSDTIAAAAEAKVPLGHLLGAMSSTGLGGRAYLLSVGELELPYTPPTAPDPYTARLNCISRYESKGFAGAYNARSGASGEFQFLRSTWNSTPQGKAGLSPFDPVAARAAARWMLAQGRAREWVPVQLGLC